MHPHAVTYPVAPDPASLLTWAPALPRVTRPQTSPTDRGRLRHYHVSRNPGPRLLTEMSSGAATCRWALSLPHVTWLWALPPGGGGAPVLPRFPWPPAG
jgi:hypothetical protein